MNRLWEFIYANIITGLFAFGGGVSFLPFFQNYYLDKYQLIDQTKFYELFGFASAMPGPIAPLFVSVVGYELFGVIGFVLGLLSFIIPSMILTAYAYKYLQKYHNHPILENISKLIIPVIVIIMLNVVFSIFNTTLDIKFNFMLIHYLFLFIVPAVLLIKFKVNVIFPIIINIVYVFLIINNNVF